MRSGDFVTTHGGHLWVVVLILPHVKGWRAGRWLFLTRPTSEYEVLACLVHETEVVPLHPFGPTFRKGERYILDGEPITVHADFDALVIFRREDDGRFLPLWRHRAAHLFLQRKAGFSFLCEEISHATEEQI